MLHGELRDHLFARNPSDPKDMARKGLEWRRGFSWVFGPISATGVV
jgi:hypothetical protein